ncbi:NAC domain-containing protein 67-like isoform X2 [Euphorbia lathyris]
MYPPAAVLLCDISFDCSNEEIFEFLGKMSHGHPLPPNVIADVNPYNYAPSNLPDRIWFLIRSKENEDIKHGFWKVKGEACKLFSNSMITGWRTTLEFFEGRVPDERKTDWVMQEYWVTHKGQGENSKVKEISSLCRVFLGMDHQKQQKIPSLHITTEALTQNAGSSGSTNKSTVEKDNETRNSAMTGELENYLVEMPPDNEGDYLELLDLEYPLSPSSSSDNSSCISMSSTEWFDSAYLLKELESEMNQDLAHKDTNCKFNISSSIPNEVVMAPASDEIVVSHSSLPALPDDQKDMNNAVLQKTERKHKAAAAGTSQNGGRKKKHKNKYLCFMPFYFLF